jgi:hypothetical protein
MGSPRADLDLVIGYDLGAEEGDYTAFVLMRRHEDGALEVLESEAHPGPLARGRLLYLCLDSIIRLRPKTVSVRIGANGESQTISNQTVEEILDGKKTWTDLMIG